MKTKTVFSCQNCGYQSPKWLGRCPDCSSWNSFVEEDYTAPSTKTKERTSLYKDGPVLLKDVEVKQGHRVKTDILELDRVLGGGIVAGSVVLIGGDPGIGKSTIALQISNQLTKQGVGVLYVSGEESVAQTKLRAQRLKAQKGKEADLYIVNQTDLSLIIEYIKKIKPSVVIIDSIQVMFEPTISSSPGSVSQVRECAGILTQLAKTTGTAIFIIGHVTKEGAIAGPRVLEHIVDTVLYFEGDKFSLYRILRAVKNRFGSTNEIGVFEMGASGLSEVKNPSEIFLSERPKDVSGSVVASILEGSRPLLVEVQALVSKSSFGYACRRTQGFDYNRSVLLVAVLEKRMGLCLEAEDIFINVAGGIKIEDPAADLAVAVAITSAFREQLVLADTLVLGEVGLAGEIRSISQVVLRINEAAKLGFKRCVLPRNNYKNLDYKNEAIELVPVSNLKEALEIVLSLPAGRQGGN
ncbi:MAG: DNA repair protein RadA [Candidatus Omnitrophica bacterium]|nr:DNA repair protein RadA [Candidatus Omnitrophota bacterium]MBU4473097.1 DNA repair protein RadA [Candidatus Omnitrophota bacterium]MCG2706856.1 DNA repair protein RadA [Candidatus Omnitrophota bacterium]